MQVHFSAGPLAPLLAYMCVSAATAASAAPQPLVRVHIEPQQAVLVGQQVRVDVSVLVPNFFLGPPAFPVLDIPGAVVTLLDERAVNSTETIDGVSYAGIQKTYAVTPEQAGEFRLPAAQIAFEYAAEPGKPGTRAFVTLPAETITARPPAGAVASGGAAPVAKVVLTQTLDRDVTGLAVGDTLTRTVESFATGTQAMMIPPPKLDAPSGVRGYPHTPELSDGVARARGGAVGGRRIDSVTYVFERAGDYALPAVEVAWLDPATGARQVSRAPAIDVSIARQHAAAPAIAPAALPLGERVSTLLAALLTWRTLLALCLLVAGLACAVWLTRHYAPRLEAWLDARRRAREDSEQTRFAALEVACRANDPRRAYRAWIDWARRAPDVMERASAAHLDPNLDAEVARLERHLYGSARPSEDLASAGSDAWSGRALLDAVALARRSHPAPEAAHARRAVALPALNP